jgi:hypothetical protein
MARIIKRNVSQFLKNRLQSNNTINNTVNKPPAGLTGSTNPPVAGLTGSPYRNNQDPIGKLLPQYAPDGIRSSYRYGRGLKAPKYAENPIVGQYRTNLMGLEKNQPAPFESKYKSQIDNALSNIQNRRAFDLNTDKNYQTLYNQMREGYMQAGDRAMRNAMGNAASLTGGYGNSYAQAVGQQAYDNYLQNLNSRNLELMNAAYGMYRDENADRYNQLRALQGLDDTDYGRYRDRVGDYKDNRNYMAGRYNSERNFDYDKYKDRLAQYNYESQFNYNAEKDALAQRNLEREMGYKRGQDLLAQRNLDRQFGYTRSRDDLAQQNWLKEFEYNKAKDDLAQQNYIEERDWNRSQMGMSGGGSGGSGGGGGRRGGGGGGRRRGGSGRRRSGRGYGGSGGGGSTGDLINALSMGGGVLGGVLNGVTGNNKVSGGYHPYTAKVFNRLRSGEINNEQAYDLMLDGYEKGYIEGQDFNDALRASGVDEKAALKKEQLRQNRFKLQPVEKLKNTNSNALMDKVNDNLRKQKIWKGKKK